MEDIRNLKQQTQKSFNILPLILKYKYYIILILFLLFILLFPTASGDLLATWISKFMSAFKSNLKY